MDAFLMILLIAIYFLPTIIAMAARHRQTPAIAVLNIALGWTVLGWVGALVWSCTK